LKTDTLAVYLAYRDPRVAWWKKAFIAVAIGYAFCPLDLIPDFIPIIGYLDDLVLVPIMLVVAAKLIPPEVLEDCREQVQNGEINRIPKGWKAAVIIVAIWGISLLIALAIVLRVLLWTIEIQKMTAIV
jgi:uncharacterized membrane protein YkvA (DUF1232 family)